MIAYIQSIQRSSNIYPLRVKIIWVKMFTNILVHMFVKYYWFLRFCPCSYMSDWPCRPYIDWPILPIMSTFMSRSIHSKRFPFIYAKIWSKNLRSISPGLSSESLHGKLVWFVLCKDNVSRLVTIWRQFNDILMDILPSWSTHLCWVTH